MIVLFHTLLWSLVPFPIHPLGQSELLPEINSVVSTPRKMNTIKKYQKEENEIFTQMMGSCYEFSQPLSLSLCGESQDAVLVTKIQCIWIQQLSLLTYQALQPSILG